MWKNLLENALKNRDKINNNFIILIIKIGLE